MAEPIKPPHKGSRNDLTAEFVRSILDYDPETGVFRWRQDIPYIPGRGKKRIPGKFLDSKDRTGAIRICFGRQIYFGHRLAWLIMTGGWPTHEIDHINRNPSDNRWANLREATSAENLRNRSRTRPNKTGYRGVIYSPAVGKWKAAVHLGHFDSPEEAHNAYVKAYRLIHGADPIDFEKQN